MNRMQKTFCYYNRWTPARRHSKQNNFTVYTLSAIFDITDKSNKLNKNISVISIELIPSFLLGVNSNTETSSFTWVKLNRAISNLKLKQMASYLTLWFLCFSILDMAFTFPFLCYLEKFQLLVVKKNVLIFAAFYFYIYELKKCVSYF